MRGWALRVGARSSRRVVGSDAHGVDMVGSAATRFSMPIRSDADLVSALRSKKYEPVRLRAGG